MGGMSNEGTCRWQNGIVRTAFRIGCDLGRTARSKKVQTSLRQSAGNLTHDNRVYVGKQAAGHDRAGSSIVRTATEAREGVMGHNVRYVLVASLAAVFAGLWLYFFA
jgi:hypothetical protein